jgi:hypothetical protein
MRWRGTPGSMRAMTQVDRDGEMALDAGHQVALLEQQLAAMERSRGARLGRWPWVLVLAGVVAVAAFGFQAYTAYATIGRIDALSRIATASPVVMFQDIATNGARVGASVEASNRATYTRALEQFVLDGTVVCLGLAAILAGLFVRLNQ